MIVRILQKTGAIFLQTKAKEREANAGFFLCLTFTNVHKGLLRKDWLLTFFSVNKRNILVLAWWSSG